MAKKKLDGKKLDHRKLALGEASGHYHQSESPTSSLWDVGGTMVLDAPDGTDITHQEHRTVSLPPGRYDRHIVREFDHFENEAREVRD